MKFFNAFLLFASLSLVNTSVSGFTLQIVQGNYTWYEAKLDAETRGGRLAILDTQYKISAVNNYLSNLGTWYNLWIGLTDEGSAGTWEWINGTPLSANNWAPGEPNNLGDERHVHIHPHTHPTGPTWNNGKGSHQGYVLESVPEPSNYALLFGILVLGIVGIRRR